MFIEKEPAAAAAAKEAKRAIEKEPPPQNAAVRKELKGMPYTDQVKAVSPRAQALPKAPDVAATPQKDPVGELRALFAKNNLPDRLAPTNAVSYTYEPGTGALTIELKAGFSKQFDAENTVTFDRVVSGILKPGELSGIAGIKRGSANIVAITRLHPGLIGIRGKMGPFSKTLEFKDEQIPSLG